MLAVSLLRLYVLWVSEPSKRYTITIFDMLVSFCACVHVLAEILPTEESEDAHHPDDAATRGDDDDDAAMFHEGGTSRQWDSRAGKSAMTALSTFMTKRKAAAEVVAMAAILRLAWDPKDVCSA